MKQFAVLTGDVVNSTTLHPTQQKGLEQIIVGILQQYEDETIFNKTKNYFIYRGDSFQFVTSNVEIALTLLIQLRVAVKMRFFNNDMRIAIGLGNISNNTGEINQSSGSAFIYSGKSLDDIGEKRMVFKSESEVLNLHINQVLNLFELVVKNWTQEMTEALHFNLQGFSQKEISKKLGINQSAVSKRLSNAHADKVNEVITYFEQAIQSL